MNEIKKLTMLKGEHRLAQSEKEARALVVIRAFRRGVAIATIGKTMGMSPAGVYHEVGRWALNHAKIPGNGK